MTDSVVAFVNEIVLAFVIAPVEELTKVTEGIETNPVPVILIVVAVAGAIVCDTSATAGFVSAIVAKDKTPDPFVTKACPFDPTDVGNVSAMLPPKAECAGASNETWCVLASQLKSNLAEFVLPLISTAPVPLAANTKSLFETVTISLSLVSKFPPS